MSRNMWDEITFLFPISKQEGSAPINCWVTAESPILPGQSMLCTYVSEFNP